MHDWYCEYSRGTIGLEVRSSFVGRDREKLPACKCAYRRMKMKESRENRGRKLADIWMELGLGEKLALEKWKMSYWLQKHGQNIIEVDFREGVRISEKVRLIDWIEGHSARPEG